MDKENLSELTNKVYKLTLLFPKKEPLRYKTREAADEILSNIISWEVIHNSNPVKLSSIPELKKEEIIFETEKNIEIIKGYFKVAKWQNWVSYFDFSVLEEECDIARLSFLYRPVRAQLILFLQSPGCCPGLVCLALTGPDF